MANATGTEPRNRGDLVDDRGWRARTFRDGVQLVTLLRTLDAALADRLWTHLSHTSERGCRHLILDATAIEEDGTQPALLASAFHGHHTNMRAVLVASPRQALGALLPGSVTVAANLADAHAQLAGDPPRARRRPSPPGGELPAGERAALVTRQSLRWAERAAREGDYDRALAWLSIVERTDGTLGPHWLRVRDIWHSERARGARAMR